MNGLGLPGPQTPVSELRRQLAMAEACEPIERELQEAKQAYRDALDDGDPETVAAAKERKSAAANHINETRTWLRREARIADLKSRLAVPQGSTPDPWRFDMEKELDQLEAEAAPLREYLGAVPQPGPPIVVEDGSASVDMPHVQAKARAMKGGK